ncbi:aspartyl-phosphate phosphatase Spo0E family protein [Anaeromicrobium sediminis]|uniref:Spo0E family sporulation regulatory protein-aspartic acid phosphatase n=1 Tax=Anaeromicrobium sediminis TaxID=1478221 RepID=A0A267MD57_9FIRM|nr:aspartyl-phosphate phosphatase Spo0E family protein [Anaeromicrobium sediminis]PAB57524.1 hypothetical protein CCE28_18645 [Anaeromicrobium sediminis]
MDELITLKRRISDLRDEMHELIDKKGNLVTPEVIHVSQTLDKVLDQYYEAKMKRNRN